MISSLVSYNKKVIISILILLILLSAYTVYNVSGLGDRDSNNEDIYENLVSKLVTNDSFDEIDYYLIKKDYDDIANIMKEQITINLENNIDEKSYIVANNIYTEKMSEFTKIMNNKLDDTTYNMYLEDVESFEKDLNFNLDSKKNDILSEPEFVRYSNEYNYQEKQRFLYDMLEKYRNFLE